MNWSARVLDRILLTNDDGIDAPGLAILEAVAAELAHEVWVVAPEHDQSGVSHAISLHHALRISRHGERRFGVSGTPGDCAVMGICHLMTGGAPQLLLSGVNRGLNLGMETVFSGTVGGAMTGHDAWRAVDRAEPGVQGPQQRVVGSVAHAGRQGGARSAGDRLEQGCVPERELPGCAAAEAGPVTLARQGVGMIAGMHVDTRVDPRGMEYHWLNFRRGDRPQGPESDYDALRAGTIVVTPLRYDRTDEDAYQALAERLPRFTGS